MSKLGPICGMCKHWTGPGLRSNTCSAFPEGIPHGIIARELDHRVPVEGDHDIRFEAKPGVTEQLVLDWVGAVRAEEVG